MLKSVIQLFGFVSVISLSLSGVLFAAPFTSGPYGACAYQTSCTVSAPPADSPVPEEGTAAPDNNPISNVVTSDIDNDGNPEEATDTDGNPANGYETFRDPDGSSEVLATTDGEHDGSTSHIIDTDGDGEADLYWSPTKEYVAPVTQTSDSTGKAWVFQNSSNQIQYYYFQKNDPVAVQNGDRGSSGGDISIVAAERRLTGEQFGGAVYEKIGEVVQKVPAPVAYSFPYLLLALIIIMIIRLLWQTKNEVYRLQTILSTIEHEKQLVLEKQNFLMLASHYLRTPLTVIKGNIELLQSLKTISDAAAMQLQTSANGIQTEVNALLQKLKDNKALEQITVTHTARQVWTKSLFSPFVIGPLILLIALILIANFIFVDFQVTQPRLVDVLVQVALLALLVQWFVSTVRKRHINRQNRLDQQRTLDAQRELDNARSTFIAEAASSMSKQIQLFEAQLTQSAASGTDISRVEKGFNQLKEIVSKFVFATKLQALSVHASVQEFEASSLVNVIVGRNNEKAAAKQITLESTAQGGKLAQNAALIGVVLDNLIDNALKYSTENSTVRIEQNTVSDGVVFSVADHGAGLTQEQLDALFKPFSRAESAETFNTEGLGFGLYLSKLIMHYLNGDITLQSSPGEGTRAVLNVPKLS